jgi:hypothetical protein
MLYVYIAAKSEMKNIFAHLHFCKEFSTPFIKTTRVGYCLTTMEVALQLLTEEENLITMDEEPDIVDDSHFTKLREQKRMSIRLSVRKSLSGARPEKFSLRMSENVLAPIAELDDDLRSKR